MAEAASLKGSDRRGQAALQHPDSDEGNWGDFAGSSPPDAGMKPTTPTPETEPEQDYCDETLLSATAQLRPRGWRGSCGSLSLQNIGRGL